MEPILRSNYSASITTLWSQRQELKMQSIRYYFKCFSVFAFIFKWDIITLFSRVSVSQSKKDVTTARKLRSTPGRAPLFETLYSWVSVSPCFVRNRGHKASTKQCQWLRTTPGRTPLLRTFYSRVNASPNFNGRPFALEDGSTRGRDGCMGRQVEGWAA